MGGLRLFEDKRKAAHAVLVFTHERRPRCGALKSGAVARNPAACMGLNYPIGPK